SKGEGGGSLVSNMWLGASNCVSPEVSHSALGKRYPAFSEGTQQEFLICVLNELHAALQTVGERCGVPGTAAVRTVAETSIIAELFEGQLSYAITCLKGQTRELHRSSFALVSLCQDCPKRFFQRDTLTRNNRTHCSRCGTKRDAAVEAAIAKAPPILVFHLKRFEGQGKHRRKLSTAICYPLSDPDLAPYSSPPPRKDAEYSLCAVVDHSGFLGDGHYAALCKHSVTRNWYRFDDAQVTKIPSASAQTDTAYLLFY
ncbi:UBP50 hydrolase, partial [Rhynochetos jubatus]|nr:UBP50 hydrolase [Rhynochetos jubatus]